MATNYPTALDSASTTLPYPTSNDDRNSPSLASISDNEHDAIIATETKLGIGSTSQTPTAGYLLRSTVNGQSTWDLAYPASGTFVGLSDTQTLTNKTINASNNTITNLSGSNIASLSITATQIANNTITATQVVSNSTSGLTNSNLSGSAGITTGNIAAAAVSDISLNAVETTDFANGISLTANTWTDFKANQNFTVNSTNSIMIIMLSASALVGSTLAETSSRIVIDSGGTPQYFNYGGSNIQSAGGYTNPFSGGGMVLITGLSAGTHTIKTQVLSTTANIVYCRASTHSTVEFFTTTVMEIKV